MNLLAWIMAFWLFTVIGRGMLDLSSIAGWVYFVFLVSVLGSYFYGETVVPIRKKLREIEERVARGDVHGIWRAEPLGHIRIGGYSLMLSTTMFGRSGIRRYYIGAPRNIHAIGLETRYISLDLTWPFRKPASLQPFQPDSCRRG